MLSYVITDVSQNCSPNEQSICKFANYLSTLPPPAERRGREDRGARPRRGWRTIQAIQTNLLYSHRPRVFVSYRSEAMSNSTDHICGPFEYPINKAWSFSRVSLQTAIDMGAKKVRCQSCRKLYVVKDGRLVGDWRDMKTAPMKSEWVMLKTNKGDVFRAHYACNLSGEEQPAFSGWFYKKEGLSSFCEVPDRPIGWQPISNPQPESEVKPCPSKEDQTILIQSTDSQTMSPIPMGSNGAPNVQPEGTRPPTPNPSFPPSQRR